MTGALSPRDRRALLGGAAVIVALVVGIRGVPAWRAWRAEAGATARAAMSQAARTESVLASLGESLDSLEATTARVRSLGPALVAGETPAEAASNLAAAVAEVARQSVVRLEAVEIRIDTTKAHRLPRVAVEAQATADIAGLASLLRSLERGPALLAIRKVVIRPQRIDGPSDQVELLTLRFSVEGLALVRPSGATR